MDPRDWTLWAAAGLAFAITAMLFGKDFDATLMLAVTVTTLGLLGIAVTLYDAMALSRKRRRRN